MLYPRATVLANRSYKTVVQTLCWFARHLPNPPIRKLGPSMDRLWRPSGDLRSELITVPMT